MNTLEHNGVKTDLMAAPGVSLPSFAPGFYDISSTAYHGSAGISRSGIMELKKSPYHYWNSYLNPHRTKKESTEDMELGSALHTKILEPHLFNEEYYVYEPVKKTSKAGKEHWEKILAEAGDKKLLKTEQYELLLKWEEALLSHPEASMLLRFPNSQYEKSLYWHDEETGVLCKARPDIFIPDVGFVDLKTINDASEKNFRYAALGAGYDIQMAMIQQGLFSLTHNFYSYQDICFVLVEKKEPYPIAIHRITEEDISKACDVYRDQLYKYKLCLENYQMNPWPSYPPSTVSINRRD